jgi:hypothetical protein
MANRLDTCSTQIFTLSWHPQMHFKRSHQTQSARIRTDGSAKGRVGPWLLSTYCKNSDNIKTEKGNTIMKKIAVVSDEENMVKELRLALEMQRYEVQANLLREYHLPDAEHLPDLILLDVYRDIEQ